MVHENATNSFEQLDVSTILHVVPRAVVNTNNIVQMNNILNGSNSSRIASLTAL